MPTLSHKKTAAAKHRPMLLIEKTGRICYRTKLLRQQEAAGRFARFISANRQFCNVEIMASRIGRGWYVQYQPVSQNARERLEEVQQNKRYMKAVQSMRSWRVVENEDGSWDVTTKDGNYQTRLTENGGCTCPDWMTRCRRAKLLCKHQIGVPLLLASGAPGVKRFDYPEGPYGQNRPHLTAAVTPMHYYRYGTRFKPEISRG